MEEHPEQLLLDEYWWSMTFKRQCGKYSTKLIGDKIPLGFCMQYLGKASPFFKISSFCTIPLVIGDQNFYLCLIISFLLI